MYTTLNKVNFAVLLDVTAEVGKSNDFSFSSWSLYGALFNVDSPNLFFVQNICSILH
jgi:hypothetical protein